MKHRLSLRVGPVSFRIGSAWSRPIEALTRLYSKHPQGDELCDFTVRLEPERPWRRWIRPSVAINGDYWLPQAAPMDLAHALLAAEMGMNLQMALGQKSWLLLHAASLEKDGSALLLTGESGAGKSTLAALLGEQGWRLMGDEFALLDLFDGSLMPFPRAISLKNGSIRLLEEVAPSDRFGPRLENTPKGTIRHLRPNDRAIEAMLVPAMPRLILYPRFGQEKAARSVGAAEGFMRLTQASTNYVALGEAGFHALNRLVATCPGVAIDYPDTNSAAELVDALWAEAA